MTDVPIDVVMDVPAGIVTDVPVDVVPDVAVNVVIDVPVGIVTDVTVDLVIDVPVAIVDVIIDVPVSIVFGVPNGGAMVTDVLLSANLSVSANLPVLVDELTLIAVTSC